MQRDVMEYDVVIVGAGPAGLSAAIRLKQRAIEQQKDISVCVLEKSSAIGGHILSGASIDPIALNELIPDWKEKGAPFFSEVRDEQILILTETGSWQVPNPLLPPLMHNDGCYIVSLGHLVQWLAEQAESYGVEIYPGFAAAEVLYDEFGTVLGVITGDMGLAKDGSQKADFTPGMELRARYTLFSEGARGSLARQLEERFNLREGKEPQHFGLGIKEIWRIKPENYKPGLVVHSMGWPLENDTGGGGFIYHQGENQVAIGFVTHLSYHNPHISPFEEFQRFKTHPTVRKLLEGGERLAYGGRAISEGGLQSLPKLTFPGGALIGCSAGLVNVPRIKGTHNVMKSGMLAAEAIAEALAEGRGGDELIAYPNKLRASWVWKDLDKVRNVKPAITRWGLWLGMAYSGVDMWLSSLGLRLPWTLSHGKADHDKLETARNAPHIRYPKSDGKLTFDRLSSIALSNIDHDDDQPNHLRLKDPTIPVRINLPRYDAPEQRYCPAAVYEIVEEANGPRLQINSQNCIHCKTCDIKDPTQNIVWTVPQGGSGPTYIGM